MEEELILVKPSMEHEKQALNFMDEVEKVDLDENIRYSTCSSNVIFLLPIYILFF